MGIRRVDSAHKLLCRTTSLWEENILKYHVQSCVWNTIYLYSHYFADEDSGLCSQQTTVKLFIQLWRFSDNRTLLWYTWQECVCVCVCLFPSCICIMCVCIFVYLMGTILHLEDSADREVPLWFTIIIHYHNISWWIHHIWYL